MTPDEQKLISELFERMQGAASAPRDREAEDLILGMMRDQPHAPYVLTQAVIVQEQGLKAAMNRISELESQIRDLQEQRRHEQPQQSGFLSGIGSLFGGSQTRQEPYGQQSFANDMRAGRDYGGPSFQPASGPWGRSGGGSGPWGQQRSGGGFLQGAMSTAAGVAGGMLMADALRGLFSTHGTGMFGSVASPFGTNAPVEETVINNFFDGNGNSQQGSDAPDDSLQQADFDDNFDDSYDASLDDDSYA